MEEKRACDNNSVGIIARDGTGRILILKRKKYPFGFAPPTADHLDGYSYADACHKEFREKTGLSIIGAPSPMPLIQNAKTYNKCLRGGEYHYWQILEVRCSGEPVCNPDETEWIGWMTCKELRFLARKAHIHLQALSFFNFLEDTKLVRQLNETTEKWWRDCPGLDVFWLDIFEELRIL